MKSVLALKNKVKHKSPASSVKRVAVKKPREMPESGECKASMLPLAQHKPRNKASY